MRHLSVLFAALLLPVAQPLLLGTAVSTGTLLVFKAPALAENAEGFAKIAQSITVRIEGATQGSGVLVKRDGNRYTVLTAWHVVSGQRPGEELDVYTPDGQRHKVEPSSIKRLGEVDMAVLSFSSSNAYELAKIGDVKSVNSGDQVLVAGFPVGSNGRLKYDSGKLVANAAVGIDQGYQLLYTNDTVSGMSGGVVLKADGTLIGMHGRGELDEQKSQQSGLTIKTGTNQGVPIAYYSLFDAGAPVVASTSQATTADDYLAQAKALLGKKGSQQEVIRLTNQALTTRQSADAYFYRAFTKGDLGDNQGAIADYNQAIAINPQIAAAYGNRGIAKSALGDKQGAIADYNRAIAIDPQLSTAYNSRGNAKRNLGDNRGAIIDYNQAIAINPQIDGAYYNRGLIKSALGDKQGAIADFKQAITINPQLAEAYYYLGDAKADLGDMQGAIADFNQAIAINPQYAKAWGIRGFVKSLLGDRYGACEDTRKSASLGSSVAQRLLPQVCQ